MKRSDNSSIMGELGKGRLLRYQVYFYSTTGFQRRPATIAIEINPIDTHGSITKEEGLKGLIPKYMYPIQ
jgi:hypothetical protein